MYCALAEGGRLVEHIFIAVKAISTSDQMLPIMPPVALPVSPIPEFHGRGTGALHFRTTLYGDGSIVPCCSLRLFNGCSL
jgi:hypothetical protein